MVINKKIKEVLNEITVQTRTYMNTPDAERKYITRILNVYKNNLTEQEQIFILKTILEQMHYRNIITDPDNVIQLHNVKLKTITYVFLLTIVVILVIAVLFKVNDGINGLIASLNGVLKLLYL